MKVRKSMLYFFLFILCNIVYFLMLLGLFLQIIETYGSFLDYQEAVETNNIAYVLIEEVNCQTYEDSDGDRHEEYTVYGSYYFDDEYYENISLHLQNYSKKPDMSEGDLVTCYIGMNDPTVVYGNSVTEKDILFSILITVYMFLLWTVILFTLFHKAYRWIFGIILFFLFGSRNKKNMNNQMNYNNQIDLNKKKNLNNFK